MTVMIDIKIYLTSAIKLFIIPIVNQYNSRGLTIGGVKMSLQLREWIIASLFAAIIAILAQISIPIAFSPVPLTGQTLAIGLVATILNKKTAVLATTIYILTGAVGMPVYSNGSGGIGVLFGATGGYLFSFVLVTFLISFYLEKTNYNMVQALIINHIAMIVTLLIGTTWLKIFASMSWEAAFISGFTPFLLFGIVKAILSAWLGIKVRERLVASKLIYSKKG